MYIFACTNILCTYSGTIYTYMFYMFNKKGKSIFPFCLQTYIKYLWKDTQGTSITEGRNIWLSMYILLVLLHFEQYQCISSKNKYLNLKSVWRRLGWIIFCFARLYKGRSPEPWGENSKFPFSSQGPKHATQWRWRFCLCGPHLCQMTTEQERDDSLPPSDFY